MGQKPSSRRAHTSTRTKMAGFGSKSKHSGTSTSPPPSYSTASDNLSHANAPLNAHEIQKAPPTEDPYAHLSLFDTIFVIDDSGSMLGSRWDEVRNILATITPICVSRDPDGIDVYFLNHESMHTAGFNTKGTGYTNIQNAEQVHHLFSSVRPWGMTPTGSCLSSILTPYLHEMKSRGYKKLRPLNIIVFTDGVPTDSPRKVIKKAAATLDRLRAPRHQVGIQFFQVGNDAGASAALQQLDDDLEKEGVRDIVDTTKGMPLTTGGVLKIVLGGVQRRFDDMTTEEINQLFA